MKKEFFKGFFKENPVFCLLLGLCPTLAVTTSAKNAIGMGAAVVFVLLCSNMFISLLRKIIPSKIRIPCFIIVIATFVTIVDLVMKAFFPALSKQLGMFIPLIVVNCIILGRAEAFANKKTLLPSMVDALGMGIGFSLALILIGSIREILGNGTFFDIQIVKNYTPMLIFILAPGAFFTMGLLLGFFNHIKRKKA
jgi:Na+-translocating ferredoxin:NAD+ oxidoreductase subunit E